RIEKIRWELTTQNQAAEIPEWAIAYKILRSKNQERSFFVQGVCRDIYNLEKYDDQGKPVYTRSRPNTPGPKETHIDISSLLDAGIGYAYSEGDRIKL